MPMVNMISGGLHAGGNLDFQDFLMIPVGASSYGEALEMVTSVYHALGHILRAKGEEAHLVGDEGGYGPRLRVGPLAVERILEAITACGLTPGTDAAIALDVAATHLYDPETSSYALTEGDSTPAP